MLDKGLLHGNSAFISCLLCPFYFFIIFLSRTESRRSETGYQEMKAGCLLCPPSARHPLIGRGAIQRTGVEDLPARHIAAKRFT